MDSVNFIDNFLIVMLILEDLYFFYVFVYVCEYNENGVLGIIVNWLFDMMLVGLFEKIEIKLDVEILVKLLVYFGGFV